MVKEILVLALDIDGVLTDGTGLFEQSESYEPRFDFHDLDAVTEARRAGLVLALVTGEDSDLVDRIARRFGVGHVMRGAKDKVAALKSLSEKLGVALENFCYVGDSDRDALAFPSVGLGIAPSNATAKAKAAAHRLLASAGGAGAVAETVTLVQRLKADAESSADLESELRRIVSDSVNAHQALLNGSMAVLVEVTQVFVRADPHRTQDITFRQRRQCRGRAACRRRVGRPIRARERPVRRDCPDDGFFGANLHRQRLGLRGNIFPSGARSGEDPAMWS
jgi:3-deoxy-D-manno-octulosonate 8-phosphate phosphatase (KDO 8-P phosphatase)